MKQCEESLFLAGDRADANLSAWLWVIPGLNFRGYEDDKDRAEENADRSRNDENSVPRLQSLLKRTRGKCITYHNRFTEWTHTYTLILLIHFCTCNWCKQRQKCNPHKISEIFYHMEEKFMYFR